MNESLIPAALHDALLRDLRRNARRGLARPVGLAGACVNGEHHGVLYMDGTLRWAVSTEHPITVGDLSDVEPIPLASLALASRREIAAAIREWQDLRALRAARVMGEA